MPEISRRTFVFGGVTALAAATAPGCLRDRSTGSVGNVPDEDGYFTDFGTESGSSDEGSGQCAPQPVCDGGVDEVHLTDSLLLSHKEKIDELLGAALKIITDPEASLEPASTVTSSPEPWWKRGLLAEANGDFVVMRLDCDEPRYQIELSRQATASSVAHCDYLNYGVFDDASSSVLRLSREIDTTCDDGDRYGGPERILTVNCETGASYKQYDSSFRPLMIEEDPVDLQEAQDLLKYIHHRIVEIIDEHGIDVV